MNTTPIRSLLGLLVLLAALAVGSGLPATALGEPATAYGFYPSAPAPTVESVVQHFHDIAAHADFILFQPHIPWADFVDRIDGDSQSRTDLTNQVWLATANGLDTLFVVDPLNGLNRREFSGLPDGWANNFDNQDVRAAFANFTLWLVRNFHPHYLGLASEINTYMDAYPEDAPNFISLYREVYAAVKEEAPDTQVFVTFQWEELNNLFPAFAAGRAPYAIDWNPIEDFEPDLDLWVISTYPYISFRSAAAIPYDYYTPLVEQTGKPLAVAEGGYTSRDIGPLTGTPDDQVAFLNIVHQQLDSRLEFWNYTLLNDLDIDAYRQAMAAQGISAADITTLGAFQAIGLRETDGTPKPALAVWDGFRTAEVAP